MRTANYKYRNLIAEMARNGDTLKTLSHKLGMNYQTLSARLQGKRNFELPEIYALLQLYNQPMEVLFAEYGAGTGPAA
ncbi:MAG: helix-turn-helix transcriptional regulator [Schwartzia sp.]|nr:helix-turn-helix transcriptional regulator [Schwartzia sp. (in: firmicutes)]